jgi:predicted alpha/beta hydrolase family esterase
MSARVKGQNLEQRMSEYNADQIKQIITPILVFHARNDTLVAYDHGEYTAKMIPGAQFISVEKGGHLALMFDTNTASLTKVQQFLKLHNR